MHALCWQDVIRVVMYSAGVILALLLTRVATTRGSGWRPPWFGDRPGYLALAVMSFLAVRERMQHLGQEALRWPTWVTLAGLVLAIWWAASRLRIRLPWRPRDRDDT